MHLDFTGKVALITGAGNGIGRAAALAFARSGAKTMIVDRDLAGGEATAGIIRQEGGDARFVAADVTKSADVQNYVRAALDAYGAIDWASRPPDQPFAGKPAAIMGAAAGMAGGARAQGDLRRSCVFLDIHPINKPEVLIGQAQTKFDAEGRLIDEAARGFIRDMLVALEAWTRQIGQKA